MIEIKSKREIELMREAGKVLAEVHEKLGEKVAPGLSTGELNDYAEGIIRKAGCTPSFLHLYDFPAACCISVNEEVIHGIPDRHRDLLSRLPLRRCPHLAGGAVHGGGEEAPQGL